MIYPLIYFDLPSPIFGEADHFYLFIFYIFDLSVHIFLIYPITYYLWSYFHLTNLPYYPIIHNIPIKNKINIDILLKINQIEHISPFYIIYP